MANTLDETLAALATKLGEGLGVVKNSVEHFTLLRDTAAQAMTASDAARAVIARALDDLEAAIHELRLEVGLPPAPAGPIAPVAPSAGPIEPSTIT